MPSGRDRLREALLNLPAAPRTGVFQAQVTAVGPPITVSWAGGTYQFPGLASYTAVVGDIVDVLPRGGSYVILGKPTGFPTT